MLFVFAMIEKNYTTIIQIERNNCSRVIKHLMPYLSSIFRCMDIFND